MADANEMLRFCLFIFELFTLVGSCWTLEHPRDKGQYPYPSIWILDIVIALEMLANAQRVHIDQCMLGAVSRKSTTISGNVDGLDLIGPFVCNHESHSVRLHGRAADGTFLTTPAARYPSELCRLLAELHLKTMLQSGDPTLVDEEDYLQGLPPNALRKEQAVASVQAQVPPISSSWDDRSRWSEVFRMRWKRTEPSNVVEFRTIVALLKHLARTKAAFNRRVLVVTDNLAALSVICKGRSSRRSMLGSARKLASLCLSTGIRLVMRWVPSGRNWADGPSRQRLIQDSVKLIDPMETLTLSSALGSLSPEDMHARVRHARAYHG